MTNVRAWQRRSEERDPSLPRPDLLSGERGQNWTIKDSEDGRTTMVNPEDKRMEAPGNRGQCELCEEEHASSIRLHELMHARHSPEGEVRQNYTYRGEKRYVDNRYIHLSEETRIDTLGKQNWRKTHLPGDNKTYAPMCRVSFQVAELRLLRSRKWRDLIELTFTGVQLGILPLIQDVDVLNGELAKRFWDSLSPQDKKSCSLASVSDAKAYVNAILHSRSGDDSRAGYMRMLLHGFKPNPRTIDAVLDILLVSRIRDDYSWLMSNPYMDLLNMNKDITTLSWSSVLKIGKELEERFTNWDDSIKHAKQEAKNIIQDFLVEAQASSTKEFDDKSGYASAMAQAAAGAISESNELKAQRIAARRAQWTPSLGKRAEQYMKGKDGGVLAPTVRENGDKRRGYRTLHVQANDSTPGQPVEWGELQILTPPLTKKFPEHKLQKSRSSARPEGSIPRNMHRFASDKQVFSEKRRVYGASLLVDDSGSMGFTHDQLEEILEIAPASTVATYAGGGYIGHLKVVARGGKRLGDNEELGVKYGGNEVDLPALYWLAQQPWPRVWISDGQVVSPSHGFTPRVVKQCMDFAREAGIILVPDAKTAEAYISGKMKAVMPTARKWKRTMKPKKGGLKA